MGKKSKALPRFVEPRRKSGIRIFARSQITKYRLSKDKKGLLAYFGKGKSYYHIHSDELTVLERWIRRLLLKLETLSRRKRQCPTNAKGK